MAQNEWSGPRRERRPALLSVRGNASGVEPPDKVTNEIVDREPYLFGRVTIADGHLAVI
jgi:hypothetical protein